MENQFILNRFGSSISISHPQLSGFENNQAGYPTELATLDPRKFWLILGLEH